MRFNLTEEARIDLRGLYYYGVERYGEARTLLFLDVLQAEINRACDFPEMFSKVEIRHKTYRLIPVNNLKIYYSIENEKITVVRILGRQNPIDQFQETEQEPFHGET